MAALDGLAVGTSIAENLSHKYDLKARPHALHVVRAWAAKGYQPIYLSGRQVSLSTSSCGTSTLPAGVASTRHFNSGTLQAIGQARRIISRQISV